MDWKTVAMLFHQDNAPPHWVACVDKFFNNNLEVVPHALYSPNFAPSNFWLFSMLPDILCDCTLSSHSALLQQQFSSGHNILLKKRLQPPCNLGVGVMKNIVTLYGWVCWEMTAFAAFLGEYFFQNKLEELKTWMHLINNLVWETELPMNFHWILGFKT